QFPRKLKLSQILSKNAIEFWVRTIKTLYERTKNYGKLNYCGFVMRNHNAFASSRLWRKQDECDFFGDTKKNPGEMFVVLKLLSILY
ncbi:MAG: hypothetical protein ACI4QZ_05880, partial [Eubacteriales bacterium]